VLNKIDVIYGIPRAFDDGGPVFAISAKTGAGLEALRAHLKKLAGLDEIPAGAFSARRRHLDALARAAARIAAAGPHFAGSLEIAAEELKGAQAELDSLTGEHTSDDLLGEIFSSFCIGK
jgi:tRNA modification GTPase